nr:RsmB/NOP family class I SAM-dependent RNA methyltransferase [Microvirga massiliensis]
MTERTSPAGHGLGARRVASRAIAEVLRRRIALDDVLDELTRAEDLEARDGALARAIAVVAFRRFGTIRQALADRLERGLPKDIGLFALLAAGAAQVLFLDVPDHAAVDTMVRLARDEPATRHAAGLVNAVLRRLVREREAILSADAPWLDAPDWLKERWLAHYGEQAVAIAAAHRSGATVDLTPKDPASAASWASEVGGTLLPTGSIRLADRASIRELPGFSEGAWWVQDAAAALPARILQPRAGERIADLCAAPGGKTAQLAAAGAEVLAVDRSAKRLDRLRENLQRLGLEAETMTADAQTLTTEPFDAILLDAPCSATGTLRRHPDAAWTKSAVDLDKLVALQTRLLDTAARLVRPGGRLVFCTCSLEPEEGEHQAARFLAAWPDFRRIPITIQDVGGESGWLTTNGDLRTLPVSVPSVPGGVDGFFAARFERAS